MTETHFKALIGQITDLHILKEGELAYGVADTRLSLKALEDHLFNHTPPLDALVMTGDLADHGDREAYEFISGLFSRWNIPVYVTPGNHDERMVLKDVLGSFCPGGSYELWPNLSYYVSMGPMNLIFLDSVVPGRHSGALSLKVASWLKNTLDNCDPAGMTIIFTHHPPFLSHMGAMDAPYENLDALIAILRSHPNLILSAGHLHRPMSVLYDGGKAVVAPPATLSMDLDLTPQGGDSFILGAPGYVLHLYEKGSLTSHFGTVPGDWGYSGPYSFSKENSLKMEA